MSEDNMEELQRWSHALEDYYTEPEAIQSGQCRCHSKMIEAPRSGEWVRFSDVQARLEAADRLADAVGNVPDSKGFWKFALDAALAAYRKEQDQ